MFRSYSNSKAWSTSSSSSSSSASYTNGGGSSVNNRYSSGGFSYGGRNGGSNLRDSSFEENEEYEYEESQRRIRAMKPPVRKRNFSFEKWKCVRVSCGKPRVNKK